MQADSSDCGRLAADAKTKGHSGRTVPRGPHLAQGTPSVPLGTGSVSAGGWACRQHRTLPGHTDARGPLPAPPPDALHARSLCPPPFPRQPGAHPHLPTPMPTVTPTAWEQPSWAFMPWPQQGLGLVYPPPAPTTQPSPAAAPRTRPQEAGGHREGSTPSSPKDERLGSGVREGPSGTPSQTGDNLFSGHPCFSVASQRRTGPAPRVSAAMGGGPQLGIQPHQMSSLPLQKASQAGLDPGLRLRP